MRKLIAFFLVLLLSTTVILANPFLAAPPAEQRGEEAAVENRKDSVEVAPTPGNERVQQRQLFLNNITIVRYITARIIRVQASIRRDLESLFTGREGKGVPLTLLLLAFVSFVYGVVHAAGPGHGKVFIGSYMIVGKSRYIDSIKAAIIIVGAHTISAVIVIAAIFAVLGAVTMHTVASTEEKIQILSSVLISAVGLFLFVNSILKTVGKKGIAGHCHSHETKGKSLSALALSVGLIPCPGVTLLILFAINLGMVPAGVVSVIAMALGMIVTISIVGVIFLAAGKSAITVSQARPSAQKIVIRVLSVSGSLMILLFGLILLSSHI